MVVSEREPGRNGADYEPEEDVESVMSEVEPTRAGDENGCEEGKNGY